MNARRRLLGGVLGAALGGLLRPLAALAQTTPLSDQQLRAAFVLNFLRYVEWPDKSFSAADGPLLLCAMGGGEMAATLYGIAGKTVKGRTVQVRQANSLEEARGCHALFFAENDARRFVSVMRALQNQPVLTIGEADGFVDVGGMIGMAPIDNRLAFEINLGMIQQAQLKASSQLLQLARSVIERRTR